MAKFEHVDPIQDAAARCNCGACPSCAGDLKVNATGAVNQPVIERIDTDRVKR